MRSKNGSNVVCPACAGNTCTDDDYKQWSPTDNPRVDCLLGRKMVFERRRAHSLCYNGRNYDREIAQLNCSCTVEDYEWWVGAEVSTVTIKVLICHSETYQLPYKCKLEFLLEIKKKQNFICWTV